MPFKYGSENCNFKHGLTKRPLWSRWRSMIERCHDPKNDNYPNWGGRGIKVCKRWRKYLNFESDMLPSFIKGLLLERIDNDGPYSPKNCRWATNREQCRNKRNNVHITFNGVTKTIIQWSEEMGFHFTTVWRRINVYGWSVEKALTTPNLRPKCISGF